MKYKASITYKITEGHPDREHVKDMEESITFSDIYTFRSPCSFESVIGYMKNDLALIAGGGYNAEHIKDIEFSFTEVI